MNGDCKTAIYIDESNKKIFLDLEKYLDKLKNSVIKQDEKGQYYISREISIAKEQINKDLLRNSEIYRITIRHRYGETRIYLKNYEEAKEKIMKILQEGIYALDQKIDKFDEFVVERFEIV